MRVEQADLRNGGGADESQRSLVLTDLARLRSALGRLLFPGSRRARIGTDLVRPAVILAAGIARASRGNPESWIKRPQAHGNLPRHRGPRMQVGVQSRSAGPV